MRSGAFVIGLKVNLQMVFFSSIVEVAGKSNRVGSNVG